MSFISEKNYTARYSKLVKWKFDKKPPSENHLNSNFNGVPAMRFLIVLKLWVKRLWHSIVQYLQRLHVTML